MSIGAITCKVRDFKDEGYTVPGDLNKTGRYYMIHAVPLYTFVHQLSRSRVGKVVPQMLYPREFV